VTKLLLILSALFGCATLGAALALFVGWPLAMTTGALAFLFLLQVAGTYTRRTDKRIVAREMALLRKRNLEFERELGETQSRVTDLDAQFAQATRMREKKIVSELKVLEGLMREFAGRVALNAKAVPHEALPLQHGPAAAYVATLDERGSLLETVRNSLEQNRIDLCLQPIVSLPQRKLRYYEALSRLRAEDGTVIMPAQYIEVAAAAGLMCVVDNLLLFRCVQIIRRLTQKNKEIGLFCNISGETLADAEFFPQFLDYMQANKDLAGQIVFEFHQESVLHAGPAGEANLAKLAALGFVLSMDHVGTLGLDFARLRAIGFRYLKVRADIITRGMRGIGATVAAEDFTRLLARHGLNLIAEHVEDERTVVQLLDYAVDFAQGYLFGEPRAVRDDGPRAGAAPDAAAILPFRRTA
jgi:cyclic-di-GMP phosphodiesterase TipF (flagellum assembly factor)